MYAKFANIDYCIADKGVGHFEAKF